jgi:hypothetical protein
MLPEPWERCRRHPLDTKPQPERQRAIGIADAVTMAYQESARTFVSNLDKRSSLASIAGKMAAWGPDLENDTDEGQVVGNAPIKTPLTIAVSGIQNGRYRARTYDPISIPNINIVQL